MKSKLLYKNKKNDVYEQALLDICKKARVKSPLKLVGKKIAFSYIVEDNIVVKIFSRIIHVALVDNNKLVIYLALNHNLMNETTVLSYKNGWCYCGFNDKAVLVESVTVESIAFEKKWWYV